MHSVILGKDPRRKTLTGLLYKNAIKNHNIGCDFVLLINKFFVGSVIKWSHKLTQHSCKAYFCQLVI